MSFSDALYKLGTAIVSGLIFGVEGFCAFASFVFLLLSLLMLYEAVCERSDGDDE